MLAEFESQSLSVVYRHSTFAVVLPIECENSSRSPWKLNYWCWSVFDLTSGCCPSIALVWPNLDWFHRLFACVTYRLLSICRLSSVMTIAEIGPIEWYVGLSNWCTLVRRLTFYESPQRPLKMRNEIKIVQNVKFFKFYYPFPWLFFCRRPIYGPNHSLAFASVRDCPASPDSVSHAVRPKNCPKNYLS